MEFLLKVLLGDKKKINYLLVDWIEMALIPFDLILYALSNYSFILLVYSIHAWAQLFITVENFLTFWLLFALTQFDECFFYFFFFGQAKICRMRIAWIWSACKLHPDNKKKNQNDSIDIVWAFNQKPKTNASTKITMHNK